MDQKNLARKDFENVNRLDVKMEQEDSINKEKAEINVESDINEDTSEDTNQEINEDAYEEKNEETNQVINKNSIKETEINKDIVPVYKNAKEKLYDKIPITVKTLDIFITICVITLVVLMAYFIIRR